MKNYKKFAAKCRSAMRDRVAIFLAKLERCQTREEIRECCEAEKTEFEEEYTNLNSRASYMTDYRKGIKAWEQTQGLVEWNSQQVMTTKGTINQHLALVFMNYPKDVHEQRKAPTETKKQEQRRNLKPITKVDEYLDTIERLLQSSDYREIAVGLIAATGRRMSEILKTGDFDQTGAYEVKFSGQVKQTQAEKEQGKHREYPIYTLCGSHLVIDARERLFRMGDIKEMRRWDLKKVDSGKNSTVNRQVVEHFTEILEPPHGEDILSSKNLRAAYANIAIYLFCPKNHSISAFITDRLGHTSDATASNYEDYQVTNEQGDPMTRGQWVKRLGNEAIQPKEVMVHKRLRMTRIASEVLEDKTFLPFPDQVSRVDELIRLARLGKAYEQGQLTVTASQPTEAPSTPVEQPQKPQQATDEKPTPASKQTAGQSAEPGKRDYESMSLAELKGLKTPGTLIYKIRKATQMIKEYNERVYEMQGKAGMYAINSQSIKALTGCNTKQLKAYMESPEGQQQIASYNLYKELGMHHNRGKTPIGEVLKVA